MPNYQNDSTSTANPRTQRQNWDAEITPTAPGAAPGGNRPWTAADTRFLRPLGPDMMMDLTEGVDKTPQMHHGLPSEVIEAPTSLNEAFLGSLKTTLLRNRGNFIVATFLIGTQNTVSWEGILYEVGNDYVTIYQPGRDRYVVIDMYSLKYMEFYDIERRRMCDQLLAERGLDGRNRAMAGRNSGSTMNPMMGRNSGNIMNGMNGMNEMDGMNDMNGMNSGADSLASAGKPW